MNKLIVILLSLIAAPVFAHHSFLSIYDQDSLEVIEGVVTEVWFENPHSRVYVEATDASGTKTVWESETYPRNILVRRGWNHNDLKEGDAVILTGRQARNGSNRVQMLTITRPSDGWEGVGFDSDSID
ncbi:MAG: DUF6152 family protein [Gammaproteobacteria bacterium]|nr:DUF6152 family protein [Gammaproteobacteria bacterium]